MVYACILIVVFILIDWVKSGEIYLNELTYFRKKKRIEKKKRKCNSIQCFELFVLFVFISNFEVRAIFAWKKKCNVSCSRNVIDWRMYRSKNMHITCKVDKIELLALDVCAISISMTFKLNTFASTYIYYDDLSIFFIFSSSCWLECTLCHRNLLWSLLFG